MLLQNAIKNFALLSLLLSFYLAKGQETSVRAKGYYSSDFVIDGIARNISFYIPAGYNNNGPTPVVFVLHDAGEAGKTVIKKYGNSFERLADSSACIVVYPDAVNGRWSAKMGGTNAGDTINDVGFVSIMIDYFVQQYNGNSARVFVAGFYNGGDLAWRLGCDAPKRVTAIAPFISSVDEAKKNCTPSIPFFNAEKYTATANKKLSYSALSAAWNFLLQQNRQ